MRPLLFFCWFISSCFPCLCLRNCSSSRLARHKCLVFASRKCWKRLCPQLKWTYLLQQRIVWNHCSFWLGAAVHPLRAAFVPSSLYAFFVDFTYRIGSSGITLWLFDYPILVAIDCLWTDESPVEDYVSCTVLSQTNANAWALPDAFLQRSAQ